MTQDSNNKKTQNILTRKFNLWSGGYIIAALVYYYGNKSIRILSDRTVFDELVVLIIAIIAGILYSRLKRRVGFIKNNVIKSIVVALGLIAVSAILIGGLTVIF